MQTACESPQGDSRATRTGSLRGGPADAAHPEEHDGTLGGRRCYTPSNSHTAAIWLVDRHEKLTALIDAGAPIAIGNLAHDFRVLIERS